MSAKERRRGERIGSPRSRTAEERLVLATGRYIGEGFDDARLDTLFLALPVSWKGTLVQYTGRLHRLHPGEAARSASSTTSIARSRCCCGCSRSACADTARIGYARGEAPLGYAERGEEIIVEYDEDALQWLKELDDFA